jgi:glycosyltransferase involved in cell wall biosynthesis
VIAPGPDVAPTISAIIPAYNAGATLGRCVAPLLRMQRDGEIAEIIVADDGSTDRTCAIAAELGVRVLASGGRLGPGGARNSAVPHACGDVLWFIDADVVVHEDSARVLSDALQRTGATALFGRYDDRPTAANFLSQYKNLVHHHYHSEAAGAVETFWGGCGAIRKVAFVDVGGFDAVSYPKPSIEDIELGARLRQRGLSIHLAPELQATHLKVWRLRNLMHTEIFRRALPWSRLIHSRAAGPATLNVSVPERLRALIALCLAASLALAAAALVPLWLPFAILIGAVAANRKLVALFYRRRRLLFAVGGILFHQLYYVYGSAAFAWCWAEQRWSTLRVNGAQSSNAR